MVRRPAPASRVGNGGLSRFGKGSAGIATWPDP